MENVKRDKYDCIRLENQICFPLYHVFKGTVATGDQFIANSEYVKQLRTDYDAYACEIESPDYAAFFR